MKKINKESKLKKEVHAQSAMEYLLTYGWSILIIAIALVTLFELGYFNGINSTLPSECIPQIGFLCNNLQLNSTGNLTLTVGNNGGQNLVIIGLGCSNSSSTPTTFSPVLLTLGQGQSKQVTFECQLNSQNIGSSFKGSLWMQLNNGQEEELGSTSATVSTGSPTGVPGSNGQGIIYLSNNKYIPNNILKLNLVNGNIINSVSLGGTPIDFPYFIALDGQELYIVNSFGGQSHNGNIILYNIQTNQLSSIDSPLFDSPEGIAFYGSNAYIVNQYGGQFYKGNIIIYNIQTNQLSSIDSPIFHNPTGISFYGSNSYITNGGGQYDVGNLIIYNTQTNQFSSIDSPLFYIPQGITFYGSNAYMANKYGGTSNEGNIIVYNTQTNQFSSIDSPLFFYPLGIAFSGSNAYIINSQGGQYSGGNLIIYNTQTNQFSSIDSPIFKYPSGLTFSSSNAYILNTYGGLFGTGNILLLNTLNNAVTNFKRFTNNNMTFTISSIFLSNGLGYFIGKQYSQYSLFTFNPFNNAVNNITPPNSLFDFPQSLVFYNNNLYITNYDGGQYGTGNLILYNTQTNQFSSIDSQLFDSPSGMAIYGYNIYIINEYGSKYGSGNLILYNTQNNQLSSIDSPLFFFPSGITFSGSNAYITNQYGGQYGAGNIIIYNTQNNQFSSFDSPDFKNPTYITKSGSDIYIYNSGNILVFNPSQEAIVNSISTLSASNYLIDGMSNT